MALIWEGVAPSTPSRTTLRPFGRATGESTTRAVGSGGRSASAPGGRRGGAAGPAPPPRLVAPAEAPGGPAPPAGGEARAGDGGARPEERQAAAVFHELRLDHGVRVLGPEPEEAPLYLQVVSAVEVGQVLTRVASL